MPELTIRPLTPGRWKDFEALFGPRGACGGCWCMWVRLRGKDYREGRGAPNKRAMKKLVFAGRAPGLLAYEGRAAVGWCALAPRHDYARVEASRVLKAIDEKPAWSVPCFFVAKKFRGRGVTRALLEAAVRFARKKGAKLLEGYPVDAKNRQADAFLWWGAASAFRKAGFSEALRRSPTRPIMRREL